MAEGFISILDGSTFVTSHRTGDIDAGPDQPHGLFYKDTRHLSRWTLRVNGECPGLLTADNVEYHFAQFFLFPRTGSIYENPYLSILRRRYAGEGFREEIEVINHSLKPITIELRIEAAADFADLFEVKDALAKKGELSREVRGHELLLGYRRESFVRRTLIASSQPGHVSEEGFVFKLELQPKSTWTTTFSVRPLVGDVTAVEATKALPLLKQDLREDFTRWIENAPLVTSDPPIIQQVYLRSLVDLAALRFYPYPDIFPHFALPAAGLPWFMALFGRDSLITSYQALPFRPELAATSLVVLGGRQGRECDDFRDEEPGKILHELRFGELTAFGERPQSPYYGTADATPLFLILLDEYERWTGDAALVRRLERSARAALQWIDQYGDRDGDGYIEYERRAETGLENQCWKDSWNSILFADGTLAPTPRATCELQGYAYDAKVRCARLARSIFRDAALAERLEREAADLKARFNRDFWIPERGFFALALDGRKRKVDSLTSNIGHLLWSGIVEDDKVESIVRHLMGPALFSGWGIRTMADGEAGFNPIEYHNGTVWPHDNALIAAGLARYGYREEASRICAALFDAARFFRFRLPEVFAGYERKATGFPVEYPTASSPQAWASGAPLLAIRILMGLEPKGEELTSAPVLPDDIASLSLRRVPGRWEPADVSAERPDARSRIDVIRDWLAEREGFRKAA
ncbi:glycogen debranching N-terminal domain-containing protein [Polyangium sorediatum]|uniref:Glycogen debranching N-terminal domain-containing protein n=1 Tax=Polyangium sorediatum TaxID=889274 RepID=A0ABT6P559_9BACT|nr:glycogen debranching N-terminal domain-containing protein [Polyangium sorediatum]MDI1435748.1 glycogen debranching N-terminal domain-containing protein [Polyangium sorediatum]